MRRSFNLGEEEGLFKSKTTNVARAICSSFFKMIKKTHFKISKKTEINSRYGKY
jgi:hypothetical protein